MKGNALAGVCSTLTRTRLSLHPAGRRPPPAEGHHEQKATISRRPPAQAGVVIPAQRLGTGMLWGHTVRCSCSTVHPRYPAGTGWDAPPCSRRHARWDTCLSWPCSHPAACAGMQPGHSRVPGRQRRRWCPTGCHVYWAHMTALCLSHLSASHQTLPWL